MKEIGIQIRRKRAEKLRRYLIKHNLLIQNLRINKDDEFVYFPVSDISKSLTSYKTLKMDFKKITKKAKSYKEIVLIPERYKIKLPTSYDIIGNIIIIKIPEELIKYKNDDLNYGQITITKDTKDYLVKLKSDMEEKKSKLDSEIDELKNQSMKIT